MTPVLKIKLKQKDGISQSHNYQTIHIVSES